MRQAVGVLPESGVKMVGRDGLWILLWNGKEKDVLSYLSIRAGVRHREYALCSQPFSR